MSGYLYPYTPYPTVGNLQSSGQAFLGGFGAGQEIESRAQEMDAKNQLQKLRQAQEERQRQVFPLEMQRAEQQMKFAAQNQPLTLEGLRLRNQATQASLNAAAQQRAAAAELARIYGSPGSGMSEMPPAAAPQPTAPPPVAPPAQGYPGLLAPYRPNAPAAAPGPQSSIMLDGVNIPYVGDAELTPFGPTAYSYGPRTARAGMSDFIDLGQFGESGGSFAPVTQGEFQYGPAGAAPVAAPPAMAPVAAPSGAAPVAAPPAVPQVPAPVGMPGAYERPVYTGRPVNQMSDRELLSILQAAIPGGGGAAVTGLAALPPDQREALISEARVAMAMRRAAPNPGYAQYRGMSEEQDGAFPVDGSAALPNFPSVTSAVAPAPGAAPTGFTQAEVTAATDGRGDQVETRAQAPAGLRPQGAPTQQEANATLASRLDTLTRETPDPLSPMDPYRVGVESRALDNETRNIEVATRRLDVIRREAAILARAGNTQGAMAVMTNVRNAEAELESRRSALALQRANLNGRINTSEFAAGNFGPMANDIFQASGGRLRLQPIEGTDKFNLIGPDGQVRGTRTRQELISDGRSLYDTNYQNQIKAIRERRVARSEEIFKATVSALEQSLKDTSAATRDIAIKTAEAQAQAQYRGSDIKVTVDQQNGFIIFQDSKNVIPTRILKVVPARDIRGREIPGQFVTQEVEAPARPTR